VSNTSTPKRQWVAPRVDRLQAGSAELGDISNPDGNVTS
jgi:hypothetical protein